MSIPRPSGLKQPSRIGRLSGLPTAKQAAPSAGGIPTPSSKAQSAIAKSARGVGLAPQHADHYAHSASCALKGRPEASSETPTNSTDNFKIGDRVWVSGTKPGIIAFIGEAQFAPGEWAGIVLDEPIGKNDGSVMGVRYFQCEAKRGVFSRLTKLSMSPQSPSRPPSQGHESSSSDSRMTGPSGNAGDSRLSVDPAASNGTSSTSNATPRPSSRLGLSSSKNLSTSSSSLHKSPAATPSTGSHTTAMRLPGTMPSGCKVGDKVLVSGSKAGILRYIGETDFAKGVWAGVELSEPLGKNDGAVAGKRYFDCKPMHGLFAPVHKISRAGSATSTPSPHSRPLMSTSLRLSRERSGSQESVSSISSTASSVSRSRVRLGVTSLANQASKTGQRPSTLNLSATTAALQKALKEKEEHIEQLLRERDLERSEVARAAAHVDEAEVQLSSLKTEKDRLKYEAEEELSTFRQKLLDLEAEKQELSAFLDEEKRKVEDLQFQLEEEALKDEDGGKSAADEFQQKELERQRNKEKERADRVEKELLETKAELEKKMKAASETEEAQATYLDQIEELTYKLTQVEARAKTHEEARVEDGVKTSQVSIELEEKANQVRELEEQLARQKKEMSGLSQQLKDMKDELSASNEKQKKQDEYIQELNTKVKQVGDDNKNTADELRTANSNVADLQRQLSASKAKAEELTSDRSKLEEQLSELMRNSGDSSSQLAALNDQLTEKTRKVEDLQNDLLSSSQNLAKAKESREELERETKAREQEITSSFEEKLSRLQNELEDMNLALEKSKNKVIEVTETLENETKEAVARKTEEIESLREQLSQNKEKQGNHEVQLTAHKQMLDKVNREKESLQHKVQQSEKQSKRLEGDKAALNTELVQARVEASKVQSEMGKTQEDQNKLQDQIESLQLEVECLNQGKAEAVKQREETEAKKKEAENAKDLMQQELVALKAEGQTKDIQLEEFEKRVEKLTRESQKKAEELMQKSMSETELLTQEMNSLKTSVKCSEEDLKSKDATIAEMKTELEQGKAVLQDRDRLIKERAEIAKEKESSEERCRNFIKEIEKHTSLADSLQSNVKTLEASQAALRREKDDLTAQLTKACLETDSAKKEAQEARTSAMSSNNALNSDDKYRQLKDEADGAKGQVDFLNSVIVELQTKNQELHHRLSAMEDSGIHTNGDFTEAVEVPVPSRRAAPRLFCDICDVFDLHDTEDCPKQAMSVSPEPTRHHGDRKNVRPYCEICESFGHWTQDCDDEQTF